MPVFTPDQLVAEVNPVAGAPERRGRALSGEPQRCADALPDDIWTDLAGRPASRPYN